MRLGVVPVEGPSHGGIWQYSLSLIRAVAALPIGRESLILPRRVDRPWVESLAREGLPIEPSGLDVGSMSLLRGLAETLPSPFLEAMRALRVHGSWKGRKGLEKLGSLRDRPEIRDRLERLRVELLLFASPDPLAPESGMPSIMAVHDLQHRLQPHFEEVSGGGQWELREYIYRNAAKRCLFLLVDSEIGKEDLLDLYGDFGAREEQVRVLPFIPAPYMRADVSSEDVERVRTKLGLPARYLFYPAQFWPHKNHVRLVSAIERVNAIRKEDRVRLVLCGTASGRLRSRTLKQVHASVHAHRLDDDVYFLGYVADEDMAPLYRGAAALVMPTFFGPTNIPVIEAWNLGCPVITSRIRGVSEQVGDAGILVDPLSVDEIADAIERIWMDESIRDRLTSAGRSRLDSYTPHDFNTRLAGILADAEELLGR